MRDTDQGTSPLDSAEPRSGWWAPAPVPLPQPVDVVHVFALDLTATESHHARLRDVLSPEERERARGFRFERHRRRFVAGRAQVRQILGAYMGRAAADVELRTEEWGRPALAGVARLRFNVSGSADVGLAAFHVGADVGVDVERVRPVPDAAALAERFFSPAERRAIRDVGDDTRELAFFRVWTRKESLVKSTGRGLAQPLDSFAVPTGPTFPSEPILLEAEDETVARWLLPVPPPRSGYLASVAVGGGPRSVACWRWAVRAT